MVWPLILGRNKIVRHSLVLNGDRLRLRPPQKHDFAAWMKLRSQSRAFLQPWEPTWPVDDLTEQAFRGRINRYVMEMGRGDAFPFFIFSAVDGALLGGLNLTNIRRGAASMASLGYWMGQPYAGKGIMSEAVRMVLPFVAQELRLRRIEAACVEDNHISLRLLEKAGFVREGLAREYLSINGVWRDHILLARLTGWSESSTS